MMIRMIIIPFMLFILFEICQSRKYKYKLASTTTPKDHLIVKKYLLKPLKKKSIESKPALCKLPKNVGLCRQSKLRFYYDSKLNKCQTFTYTGCRGNKNNFRSALICEKTCKN
ncbi:hypothetical protein I4U23_030264 [Adineta vaga]|nr:hypothetical protein I4U23_030264 [Adineta vaga]